MFIYCFYNYFSDGSCNLFMITKNHKLISKIQIFRYSYLMSMHRSFLKLNSRFSLRYLLEHCFVTTWNLLLMPLVLMVWTALHTEVSQLTPLFLYFILAFFSVKLSHHLLQGTKLAKKVLWPVDFMIKDVQSWSLWKSFDKIPCQSLQRKSNSKMSDHNLIISFICPYIFLRLNWFNFWHWFICDSRGVFSGVPCVLRSEKEFDNFNICFVYPSRLSHFILC